MSFILLHVRTIERSVSKFISLCLLPPFDFSISGCSGTVYAYLSEFLDKKHRDRAMMIASMLFGLFCMTLPLIALCIINQDWQFYIPYIDIVYKPWRLFLVACSSFGFLSFLIISALPESPKFVSSQGRLTEAYEILQKVHRINNGKNAQFEPFELYEEQESIENRKLLHEARKSRFAFFKCVWIQTAPLFQRSYLFATTLLCFLQFCIFATANGMQIFLAVILNRMATNLDDYFHQRALMCDVINMKANKFNETNTGIDGNVSTSMKKAAISIGN